MKMFRHVLFLSAILLLSTTAALAQLDKGSLSGAVTDGSGASISGAKVTVTSARTGVSVETVSTSTGLYVFPNLDPATYTLVIEQAGFKKISKSNIVVSISNRSVADVQLEVGDVTQTVTITDESPQLQTVTSEIGTTFSPKLFNDVPISAGGLRNPEAFIGFQPGVVNGAGAEGGISGGARRSKEILIDGANATNPESGGVAFNGLPSVESLGEFKLINNTFAAEYGRTGGGIESFSTKSGGNQYHGTVYDFHTSSALSAAAWATKAGTVGTTPARKPPTHGNNYGFAFGGPIYLPKKIFGPLGGYNESKDKTFFHFTTDNFRNSSSSAAFYNLPTAKQRLGDFSESTRLIYDPLTGLPFPGNVIPSNRFSNVSRNILALLPAPINSNLQQNYLGTLDVANKQDSWSLKLNHNFSTNHLLSFYFTRQFLGQIIDGPLPSPLLGANRNAISANRPIFIRMGYDWVLTPQMNLHLSYGITKLRQYFDNQSVGKGWPEKLGLKGVEIGEASAFPVVRFTDARYLNIADTNGPKTKGTQFNLTDHVRADLNWVRGNFTWKFGVDKRWMRTTGEKLPSGNFDDAGVQGDFSFSPFQTALSTATSTTGDSFASFLLGGADSASRNFNGPGIAAKFGYNAAYLQTDWRVRPNLTLNIGFRYEIPEARSTDPDAFTSFDPNLTDPRSGLKGALAFAGEGAGRTGKRRFADTNFSSFGPRLGLAWSIGNKTVVRAGYGIYYAAGNGLTGGFCIRCTTGFASTAAVAKANPTAAALNWDNGFVPSSNFIPPPSISPSAGNATDDIWYISPKSGTAPRFQNWSLSMQRELPFKFVFEAAYIGNRGTRLSASHFSLNLLDPKFYSLGTLLNSRIDDAAVVSAGYKVPYANFIADWGAGATLARALRPYPHIQGPINNEYNPVGSSWYDSLQLKLDRRFGNLYTEFNYTYSRNLTNASGSQTSGDSGNRNPKTDRSIPTLGEEGVLAFEKSYSYIDVPHIFNGVVSLDLPFGHGKKFLSGNAFADKILGGWTASFAGNYTSGALMLLNAPNTYPQWGFAYGRKRVNIVQGATIQTGIARKDLDPRDITKRWLTTNFFTIPGPFELGNAPVYLNELRDANAYNDNFGLIKRTRLTETVNFEIRAEFFNIFNRTNFGVTAGLAAAPRPNVLDTAATGRFGVANGVRSGARTGQMAVKINF